MKDEMKMNVYLVMGDDFPERVYAEQADAEKFCAEKMVEQKRLGGRRVYWHIYLRTCPFRVLGASQRKIEATREAIALLGEQLRAWEEDARFVPSLAPGREA